MLRKISAIACTWLAAAVAAESAWAGDHTTAGPGLADAQAAAAPTDDDIRASSSSPDRPPSLSPAAASSPSLSTAVEKRSSKRIERKRKSRRRRARLGRAGAADASWAGFALRVPVTLRALAGVFRGHGLLREDGSHTLLAASLEPTAKRDRLEVSGQLDVRHRETAGARLRETRSAASVGAKLDIAKRTKLYGGAAIDWTRRPGWPDPYQPDGAGGVFATSRRSHWDRSFELGLLAMPKHQRLRVEWRYTLADYDEDPMFDAVQAPTHLVPADHEEHRGRLIWAYRTKRWSLGPEVTARSRHYFFRFAGDAGTGKTHAGPGGPPPNPLYQLVEIEPALAGEIELDDDRAEIGASYGVPIAVDRFEGYRSNRGHHPALTLRWGRAPWSARAAFELEWRTYGPNSYAAGDGHPPLLSGDRRVDRKYVGRLTASRSLGSGFAAVLELGALRRCSNLPPYQPGVYPASREYDVDWTYTNWSAGLGLEWTR